MRSNVCVCMHTCSCTDLSTLLTVTVPHQGVALLESADTHTHAQLGFHEKTDSHLSTQICTENPSTHALLRLLGLKGEHQLRYRHAIKPLSGKEIGRDIWSGTVRLQPASPGDVFEGSRCHRQRQSLQAVLSVVLLGLATMN